MSFEHIKLPIILVGSLLAGLAAGVWSAGTRVATAEAAITRNTEDLGVIKTERDRWMVAQARIEEKLSDVAKAVERIEARVSHAR